MKHIYRRADKKFDTVNIERGETLASTSQGYNRKAGVWKNLMAQWKSWAGSWLSFPGYVLVQDDTVTPSVVYKLFSNGNKERTTLNPKKSHRKTRTGKMVLPK